MELPQQWFGTARFTDLGMPPTPTIDCSEFALVSRSIGNVGTEGCGGSDSWPDRVSPQLRLERHTVDAHKRGL